ncbi:MAG: RNA methyltransferase [Alphaproteobacteria bacterium]|nr:RNA methyltransferase [Alphaproteobacteria bacterium]
MLPISSLQNPTVKLIRSLDHKKDRRDTGLFVAEGLAMLDRAEAMGWEPDILVTTKPQAIFNSVKPTIVTEKVMAELSAQNNPHDILAVFKQRYQPHPTKQGVWLALDEIRDPGNLGTILRTADAADVSGVILIGDSCDPYAPESVRASTGSIFGITLVRMKQDGLIDLARAWDGEVVGTASSAKHDFRRVYKTPTLLMMGNESRGLSHDLTSSCTNLVRIPMKEGVESLNVAVATGLMLYQITAKSK